MPSTDEVDYELLRQISRTPSTSQRGLAGQLGISVGKVNYCLQALAAKGWVKVNNFRRSDNKLGYVYLLTPSGIAAKTRLTQAFLHRKLREFDALEAEIAALRAEADALSGAPVPPGVGRGRSGGRRRDGASKVQPGRNP